MQLIITDARLARSRCLRLPVWGLLLGLALLFAAGGATALLLQPSWREAAATAQQGAADAAETPVLQIAAAAPDPLEQERAQMRQDMDEMARRLGDMQARLVQLQSLSDRVAELAGVPAPSAPFTPASVADSPALLSGFAGGAGGPLVGDAPLERQELQHLMALMDARITAQADFLTVAEDQLFNDFLDRRMIPTTRPLPGRAVGSGFGTRIDPFTGRKAQHMGLDFQAPVGTPILAAAGGIVITHEYHHAYGHMLEIDHGNNLITRYAHASRLLAQRGDVVRRGDKIAEVGSTGRSTGAHLHFEVLLNGQQQNPQRFLKAGQKADWSDLLAQRQ